MVFQKKWEVEMNSRLRYVDEKTDYCKSSLRTMVDRKPKEFFSTKELSEYWSKKGLPVSTATLNRLRSRGDGPKSFKVFGKVLYHIDDIKTYESVKMGRKIK